MSAWLASPVGSAIHSDVNKVPTMPHILTRHSVFSLCTKLVGHFSVGEWLRVAAVFIKGRAAAITIGWDNKVDDAPLTTMIKEVLARVYQENPVRGKWCAAGPDLYVWVDASSLAIGVSLERNGATTKDTS